VSNDLNQCHFIGRLGKDPETRYTSDGKAVCNFSIAVGYKYGETEDTEWVRCVAFGKLGEICDKYMTKGKQVFVGGRMKTRKWQDKNGQDRYSTEIIAERVQLLGSKPEGESAPRGEAPEAKPKQDAGDVGSMDDDIPF
jgi:single-strand DNA-binding protein